MFSYPERGLLIGAVLGGPSGVRDSFGPQHLAAMDLEMLISPRMAIVREAELLTSPMRKGLHIPPLAAIDLSEVRLSEQRLFG